MASVAGLKPSRSCLKPVRSFSGILRPTHGAAHLFENERRPRGASRAVRRRCRHSRLRSAGWRLIRMRLSALLFSAIVIATPASAQQAASTPAPSPPADAQAADRGHTGATQPTDPTGNRAGTDEGLNLPVSLDKIKEALQQTSSVPPLKI